MSSRNWKTLHTDNIGAGTLAGIGVDFDVCISYISTVKFAKQTLHFWDAGRGEDSWRIPALRPVFLFEG